MGYSEYHARDWARGKSNDSIREEITRCDKRYYKHYPLNGTESAQNTINRIGTLKRVLEERKKDAADVNRERDLD